MLRAPAYWQRYQRRRLTTQYTSVDRVLPRKARPRRPPLRVGDDQRGAQVAAARNTMIDGLFVDFWTETYAAYWTTLHAITFLVPYYRAQGWTDALQHVAQFFDTLGEQATLCAEHCKPHYQRELQDLPAHSTQQLVLHDADPWALARWLHRLHNNIHRQRREARLPDGRFAIDPTLHHDDVPWEQVYTFYTQLCLPQDPKSSTVVEAFLFSEFHVAIRSDFSSPDIMQAPVSKKHPHLAYFANFGKRFKPIYPTGHWNAWWWRINYIADHPRLGVFPVTHLTVGAAAQVLVCALVTGIILTARENAQTFAENKDYITAKFLRTVLFFATLIVKLTILFQPIATTEA